MHFPSFIAIALLTCLAVSIGAAPPWQNRTSVNSETKGLNETAGLLENAFLNATTPGANVSNTLNESESLSQNIALLTAIGNRSNPSDEVSGQKIANATVVNWKSSLIGFLRQELGLMKSGPPSQNISVASVLSNEAVAMREVLSLVNSSFTTVDYNRSEIADRRPFFNKTGFLPLSNQNLSIEVNRSDFGAAALTKRAIAPENLPVEVVYSFPDNTLVENLAVRSNGQILVTEDFKPRLWQVDSYRQRAPIVVHDFENTIAILGIVETSPDVFYVNSASYTVQGSKGSRIAYIFQVDLRNFSVDHPGSAQISKVATLPQAQILRGLTYLGGNSTLLLTADPPLGAIWSVDVSTGEHQIAINDKYMQGGLDGLKIHNGSLYFTNTRQRNLVRVPINSRGKVIGNYTVLYQGNFTPDGFAFDDQGDIYLTENSQNTSGIIRLPQGGGPATRIASIANPTACAFGRTTADQDTLYVITDEGFDDPKAMNATGKVLAVALNHPHYNDTLVAEISLINA
ncbi:hypothetical protein ACLMJK_006461 [Lecanora helva]